MILYERDHSFKTSAIFYDFLPLPPSRRQFFTTIRRQIWPIFDPSPPKECRRLKWMVPKYERIIRIVVAKLGELDESRTTDTQRGNSLHCTAENSLPLPNF